MRCESVLLVLWLAAAVAVAAPLPAVKSVAVRDGRLLVNDRPFFPVGIYHVGHWHKALPEAGARGFNVAQVYGSTPQSLRQDIDDAFAAGLYAAVALNGQCENPALVERLVLACRDAPGLLVWSLEDEPNIRLPEPKDKPHAERPFRLPPEKLQPIHDLIHRLDPVHPVWLNLAHGFAADHAAYRDCADIHSNDIYPVPEVALPAVAAYGDALAKGVPDKLRWLAIQMAPVRPQMGEKDRDPNPVEARCMSYMALVHGAAGLWYYAFNERPGGKWRASESAPARWAQWGDLTAELHSLAPLLTTPEPRQAATVELLAGPASGPWRYPPLHVGLRQGPDSLLMIAVNGLAEPVKARLALPMKLQAEAAVRFENRTVRLAGGTLEDSFEPYAVHVYEIPLAK